MHIQNELALNNALYRRLMRQLASGKRMLERSKSLGNDLAVSIIKASIAETETKMRKMESEATVSVLTQRLTTCPLDDFATIQAELFKAQNELKGLTK